MGIDNKMKLKSIVLTLLIGFQFLSCTQSTKEEFLLGKWELVKNEDSFYAEIEFREFNYNSIVSPNSSNSSKGKWWINNSNLFMTYDWIGGKDTLCFDILKISENDLMLYKTKGGIKQNHPDTLKFKKRHIK